MGDTVTAATSPRPLRELLDTLPQELYDQIYEEAFTAASGTYVIVAKNHKPPAAMQVDRASRRKFIESYYCQTIFILEYKQSFAWLRSLRWNDVDRIKDIRMPSVEGKKKLAEQEGDAGWKPSRPQWGFIYHTKLVKVYWPTVEAVSIAECS